MLVALQLVGAARVPLNAIVLVPWVAPKFAPAIVTAVPTGPDAGVRLVMLGTLGAGASTVRLKVVVCVTDPATAVTVIVEVPSAAVPAALSVRIGLHGGAH